MNKKLTLAVAVVAIMGVVVLSGCVAGPASPGKLSLGDSLTGLQVNLGNQQGIWVNGEGKVKVVPDVANLSLGISVQKASVAEAQKLAAQAMDQVMSVLTSKGVEKKDIQTQYFNISQVTRWDNTKQEEIVIGYRVSNTVNARIRNIDNAGTIIDAVAATGGDYTRINSISFTISDPTVYYKEARDKAMADAKAKADQIATLAGISLGKPTYISESSFAPPVPIYRQELKMGAAPAAEPTTPISPGEMEVTLNVQVAYSIR
ncbi:MAG: SIMPL domain-containing protein [Chloroflexi bacterium]|nr:SIMPL domain-containing protein [Chloroflexota bacterium]